MSLLGMVLSRFPRSLKELKDDALDNHDLRKNWVPLEPYFRSQGLALWVTPPNDRPGSGTLTPPDERPRAPDGFMYRIASDMDRVCDFCITSPFLCPARTVDGRDVIIRIVSIGNEGVQHRKALERLATGNVASVIGNHTVPVLQWLKLDDIVFAVFPYLSQSDPTLRYLYEDTGDLLAHLIQMTEAMDFCHSKLVAHRDLFEENFLCNFYGTGDFDARTNPPPPGRAVRPLRSLFPFTVYLIDFERAICFDPDSDPSTRRVTGRPLPYFDPKAPKSRWEYNVPVAPEMDKDEPYDPFPTDVWQLGTYFSQLEENNTLPAGLLALIRRMTAESPSERPTAGEALAALRNLKEQLSLEELRTPVWIPPTAAPAVPNPPEL